jgi:DNA-binding winged helix-turn-helix (wHTH) protein
VDFIDQRPGEGADSEASKVFSVEEITNLTRVARFGVFEVDLRSGELRKNGLKIKLQEQPFQVLAMLLQRSGDVVTREELQKAVWTADTFVDFDRGLNKAINKIREALGDPAHNPCFVETLPRHGYRFIVPVSSAGVLSEPSPGPSADGPPSPSGPTGRGLGRPGEAGDVAFEPAGHPQGVLLHASRGLRATALLAMLALGLAVGWLVRHRSRSVPELKQSPPTA